MWNWSRKSGVNSAPGQEDLARERGTELLQLALEACAVRVLVPVANKTQFASVPEEVIERMDVVFFADVDRAVLKTLEI